MNGRGWARVETVPGGWSVDSGQRGWLGNGMTGRFGPTRFATLPTVGAADHGNDGKPLALGTNGIADQGQWYEVVGGSRRYGPVAGCRRGLA